VQQKAAVWYIDRLNKTIVMFRGSRKHILDWTSSPEFCVELLQLVAPVEVRASGQSRWMPRGYGAPAEARLETFGPEAFPDSKAWSSLHTWWLAHEEGPNTPNWDVALSCEVEGQPGLVLVEAKANVPELSTSGKLLDPNASQESCDNHDRIGAAITEACLQLRRTSPMTCISRDSHYQLSNRVAFTWKLATLGLNTVLVYLGFCGDDGIADVGEPIRDAAHWNEVFAAHAHSLIPEDLFERRINCGAASMWLQVRSRHVIEASKPAVA
jgi:hypothetical protein